MNILATKKTKKQVKQTKPEVKLRTFEVQVYPKPFEIKVLAPDVEGAMKEGISKFKDKFPTLIMSGINVQQK